jgi:hypothetical protein
MSPLLLALALSATSTSKLGVVVGSTVLGPGSPAAPILAACPRAAVFQLDGTNGGDVSRQIQYYQAVCPTGTVVAEMTTLGGGFLSVDASTFQTWWNSVWFQQLQMARLLGKIDVVVGPPNVTGTTGPADVAAFWAAFAQQVATYGQNIGQPMLAAIGAVGPGVPPDLQGYCASLAQVRAAGIPFAWSYHGRSAMTSATTDDVLAYRQIAAACQLGDVPLYVTQAGTLAGTWQPSNLDWMWWLEQQLAQDSNVAAVALYAIGASPDLAGIATPFAAYLQNPGPQNGGGGGGGGGGGSVGVLPQQPGGSTGVLSGSTGGCSTAGAGFLGLLALPALLARRLARRRPSTLPRFRT